MNFRQHVHRLFLYYSVCFNIFFQLRKNAYKHIHTILCIILGAAESCETQTKIIARVVANVVFEMAIKVSGQFWTSIRLFDYST